MLQKPMTDEYRRLAHVSLHDADLRERVVSALDRAGWASMIEPTGFHLLSSIADLIEGASSWWRPGLIVIDALSRGCAGTTIALGLRDLGIEIPIVLVTAPGQPVPLAGSDRLLHVVDSAAADRVVAEIVRSAAPSLLQEAACIQTSTSESSSNAA